MVLVVAFAAFAGFVVLGVAMIPRGNRGAKALYIMGKGFLLS